MAFRSPIGISDFRLLREAGAHYVDKTAFIEEILASPTQVLLFPRPRRFGKTLNLSTLRCFLEKDGEKDGEGRCGLFEGLAVWRSAEARAHFGRYPVIHLSFKDVKERSWPETLAAIRRLVGRAFDEHRELLASDALSPAEKEDFRAVVARSGETSLCTGALADLSRGLARHHGERAVILVDEYDIPIQSGFAHGYYDEVATFFRNFLSAGLKDNPYLFKGVLTGVLRVAKESIFSGLNNVEVHSVLGGRHAAHFGFTEAEVRELCASLDAPELADEIRRWYDGYRFGAHVIYNPWSVINFAAKPDQGFRPYWVFTAADDVLRGLVLEREHAVAGDFEALLRGEAVDKEVHEHVVLRDVDRDPRALWSLLLAAGYLTARSVVQDDEGLRAALAIPNVELRYVFKESIRSWLAGRTGSLDDLRLLTDAMFAGDAEGFGERLSELTVRTLSVHDTGGRRPERVYQAFVLGLLVHLGPAYEVRSDRESGLGRVDVTVTPTTAGRPGAVLELKRLRVSDRGVDAALSAALRQIEARRYATELAARGAAPVVRWGVVFDGKQVWVRQG